MRTVLNHLRIFFFSDLKKIYFLGILFTSTRMLIGASSTLFLISKGIRIDEIAVLKGLQALVILIVDIPFGYFADKYSKKLSIIIGICFGALWMGFTAYSPSTYWLYLGEVCNAISLAFFNGAFQAILIDKYKEEYSSKKDLKELLGDYAKYNFFFMALAVLVGGISVNISSNFFWWVGSIVLIIEVILCFFFIENSSILSIEEKKQNWIQQLLLDCKKIKTYFNQKVLIVCFALSILSGFFYQTFIQFWQPMIAYQYPSVEKTLFYSIVFFLILLGQSFAGKLLKKEKKISLPMFYFLISFICFIMLIGLKYYKILLVPSIIIFFCVFRFSSLLLSSWLNEQISGELRATYLSISSTILRLILVVIAPFIAFLINQYGLISIVFLGISTFLFSVLLSLTNVKIKNM